MRIAESLGDVMKHFSRTFGQIWDRILKIVNDKIFIILNPHQTLVGEILAGLRNFREPELTRNLEMLVIQVGEQLCVRETVTIIDDLLPLRFLAESVDIVERLLLQLRLTRRSRFRFGNDGLLRRFSGFTPLSASTAASSYQKTGEEAQQKRDGEHKQALMTFLHLQASYFRTGCLAARVSSGRPMGVVRGAE